MSVNVPLAISLISSMLVCGVHLTSVDSYPGGQYTNHFISGIYELGRCEKVGANDHWNSQVFYHTILRVLSSLNCDGINAGTVSYKWYLNHDVRDCP
jgi:hypothetical protein